MIGLEEIRRCDEHPDVDFSDEKEVEVLRAPREMAKLDVAGHRVLRVNVRPPAIALAPLRRRATRSTVDPFRARPPLAALDRARASPRVFRTPTYAGKSSSIPRTAVLFPRRSTTPGWDARARDAN